MIRKAIFFIVLSVCCITQSWATTGFVVQKIQVVGLQRISRGTVLSYMPIRAGDRFTAKDGTSIIQALYKTNFFTNITLLRKGSTLIVTVVERPTIGALHLKGNRKIPTKQLVSALKRLGFSEGSVFDKSILLELKQALLQQYYNLGRYNARVTLNVTRVERNRVTININIYEGAVAKIKLIRIIGNRRFSEETLLKNFSLTTPTAFSWFTQSDQYSRMKLDADLEKLRSYYFNRGFLQFKIDSTQVSITPDKRRVYIVIHLVEGPIYRVSGFTLTGNLLGKKKQLLKIIDVKQGDVFSRQKIITINSYISAYLGTLGYAFPKIEPLPKLDTVHHTVFITFNINPLRKVYIRRIIFHGNAVTAQNVFRRELRQMEGGLYNLAKIEESKRNLANLPFVKGLDMQLKPVEGHPGQADMVYNLQEKSAASISAHGGFSTMSTDKRKSFGRTILDGLVYGAGITDGNFLGEGKTVGLQFSGSAYQKSLSFNYFNPYFTPNKIGFGYSIYYNYTTPEAINLAAYTTDTYGISFNWSYPISEYSSIYFGPGYEYTKLRLSSDSPTVAKVFVQRHGSLFDEYKLNLGWNFSYLDRYLYPTKGFTQGISLTGTAPFGKRALEYYQAQYSFGLYQPLFKNFVFHLRGAAAYGNGYDNYNRDGLPFLENYFAGGIGTVRGYENNTLGPKNKFFYTDPNTKQSRWITGDAIGGNIYTVATAAIIFPTPFGDTVRTSAFVDGGNVYRKQWDVKDLRYSVGVQLKWRTPFAPLVFSYAIPLNNKKGDHIQNFQFSVSTGI